MAQHYIDHARTGNGERLFWLDEDDDWNKNRKPVYKEQKASTGGVVGSTKLSIKYNPSKRRFVG